MTDKGGRPRNPTDMIGFADSRVTAQNFSECNRLNARLVRGLKKFDPDECPSPQKRGQMHPSIRLFYWLSQKGDRLIEDNPGSAASLYREAAKQIMDANNNMNRSQKDMALFALKVKELQHVGALGKEEEQDLTDDEAAYFQAEVAKGRTYDSVLQEIIENRDAKEIETDEED